MAAGKPVWQRTASWDSSPEYAVDGNTSTRALLVNIGGADNTWLAVDLESVYVVHRVVIKVNAVVSTDFIRDRSTFNFPHDSDDLFVSFPQIFLPAKLRSDISQTYLLSISNTNI